MQTKKPFLYTLTPCGENQQDYLLKRIYSASGYGPNVWAMHMDLDDDTPEHVLIFVQAIVPADEVETRIDRSSSYFVRQLQPYLLGPSSSDEGLGPADERAGAIGKGARIASWAQSGMDFAARAIKIASAVKSLFD